MNKILISLIIIGAIGAIAAGVTVAYFSDTETSIDNTFTAGTIDISVNGQNPWHETFSMDDMKPCYTDYINFRIENDHPGANPVDIWKRIYDINEESGVVTEPECVEQSGAWTWDSGQYSGLCTWSGGDDDDNNNLSSVIWYDLKVEVYNGSHTKIWWQTIYVDGDGKSIDDVYGDGAGAGVGLYLGMIPAGGYMEVEQSYHMDPAVENWAQGDIMTFDIEVKAVQLHGTVVLENKTGDPDYKIVHTDDFAGTLNYEVKYPTFKFDFSGKAPEANTGYTLVIGEDPWNSSDSYALGSDTSDNNGDVDISDNINLDRDYKNSKVWLVLSNDWNANGQQMHDWNQTSYLLETGLFWYEDNDL